MLLVFLTAHPFQFHLQIPEHFRDQPDDFNGYSFFYVRFVTVHALDSRRNIVEEYVLLSVLQHIFVGLKRTRDQKLSSGLMSGQLSLAITG